MKINIEHKTAEPVSIFVNGRLEATIEIRKFSDRDTLENQLIASTVVSNAPKLLVRLGNAILMAERLDDPTRKTKEQKYVAFMEGMIAGIWSAKEQGEKSYLKPSKAVASGGPAFHSGWEVGEQIINHLRVLDDALHNKASDTEWLDFVKKPAGSVCGIPTLIESHDCASLAPAAEGK